MQAGHPVQIAVTIPEITAEEFRLPIGIVARMPFRAWLVVEVATKILNVMEI